MSSVVCTTYSQESVIRFWAWHNINLFDLLEFWGTPNHKLCEGSAGCRAYEMSESQNEKENTRRETKTRANKEKERGEGERFGKEGSCNCRRVITKRDPKKEQGINSYYYALICHNNKPSEFLRFPISDSASSSTPSFTHSSSLTVHFRWVGESYLRPCSINRPL